MIFETLKTAGWISELKKYIKRLVANPYIYEKLKALLFYIKGTTYFA